MYKHVNNENSDSRNPCCLQSYSKKYSFSQNDYLLRYMGLHGIPNANERDLMALPVCHEGLGLSNPSMSSDNILIRVSAPFIYLIVVQSKSTFREALS